LELEFTIGDAKRKVRTDGRSPTTVTVDDRSYDVDWKRVDGNVVSLLIAGRSYTARVARDEGGLTVWIGGHRVRLEVATGDSETVAVARGGGPASGAIKAPMPGSVVKVLVAEGDEVEVNQSLVIVEAMKMENEVRAPVAGIVKKVSVAAGSSVGTTDAMIEIEPRGDDA
jgi:acetyl/propionyl-CoA carboxylase alpha subunit